jgi:CheY-like chemotaxis protein
MMNLYVNAADAMPKGGDLYLHSSNVTDAEMINKPYNPKQWAYVLVTVRDTCVGMEDETIERVFEPFFTTKGLAKGTGLGLASVYGIVKAHGGYIDVQSKKFMGTTFHIYLPAIKTGIERTEKPETDIISGKGTILLVDDEEIILDVGSQILGLLGYTVLLAKSGQEAIRIYDKNKDKINMVILDMIMPDMGGSEAYEHLRQMNPGVKVLLCSGYSMDEQAEDIVNRGCNGFIQKPFDVKDLSHKVKDILKGQASGTLQ